MWVTALLGVQYVNNYNLTENRSLFIVCCLHILRPVLSQECQILAGIPLLVYQLFKAQGVRNDVSELWIKSIDFVHNILR